MESKFVDALISLKMIGGVARLEFGKISQMSRDAEGKPQIKVESCLELLIPAAGLNDAIQQISKSLQKNDESSGQETKAQ